MIRPQLPSDTQMLTTGCPIIDDCLAGGIPLNSITELVAESGSGKTQLSLQLLLSAQLPLYLNGLSASSLYLHSEYPFPIRRFHQLSRSFISSYPDIFKSIDPCDRVFVHPLHSADHLLDLLLRLDPILANPTNSTFPVKLIVIDSIAALFRSEFDNTPTDLKRRSALFFKISAKLKLQALKFGLAVVITNQVVDVIDSGKGGNGLKIGNLSCLYSSGRRVCPALGLSWANCVNSRLFISRNDEVEGEEDNSLVNVGFRTKKRQLHVIFAPHLPYTCCEFIITREGVFGLCT